MGFKPTKQQQDALGARGRVLVSAAAGSGKTAVLVERVAEYILDEKNPIDADRLLIVTFTNAAAAEMRGRISKRVSDEIRKNPMSARLKRQQFLLTKASICTIDSFCIELVRNYFYLLDIRPDFKIADNALIHRISSKCIENIINRYYENGDKRFFQLSSMLGAQSADERITDAVLKIHGYLCSIPFADKYLESAKKMYKDFDASKSEWSAVIFDYLRALSLSLYRRFSAVYDELLTEPELFGSCGDVCRGTQEAMSRLTALLGERDFDGVYEFCGKYTSSRFTSPRGYSDTRFKDKVKNCKNECEDFIKKTVPKYIFADSETVTDDLNNVYPAVEVLFEIVDCYRKEFYLEKQRRGCMEFSDIESAALRLLVDGEGEPTDVARELSARYAEVMVDEYQDTNDLQDTIFNALSDNGAKLFMVGDVKQSIYRFRRANPNNFLACRNSMQPYKKGQSRSKVVMSGNFRSAPEICDFVNFTFSHIMSESAGQMEYADEDMLLANAPFESGDTPRAAVHIIDGGTDDDTLEARHIADYIKKAVGGAVKLGEGQNQTPKYGDIAVLLRTKKHIQKYIRIFKEAGIPVWTEEKGGFLQTREITVMLSLLRVIDNPQRDIPLLSLMMSSLYMFSPDEMARIRSAAKNTSLYSAVLMSENTDEKVKKFLADMKRYRRYAVFMSVSELIRKIYDETGFINISSLGGDRSARANLILLIEYAKGYEESSVKGLGGFLRYIDQCSDNPDAFNKASVVNESDDAVKIMTIHRSKGLQFPICICAELSGKFNTNDINRALQIGDRLYVGLKVIDKQRGVKYPTLAHKAIALENSMQSMAEELRVLYVAMTRAQERLIMTMSFADIEKAAVKTAERLEGSSDNLERIDPQMIISAKSYADMLLPCVMVHSDGGALRRLAGMTEYHIDSGRLEVGIYNESDIPMYNAPDAAGEAVAANEEAVSSLKSRLEYVYPFERVNLVAAKQSASKLSHDNENAAYACTAVPLFMQNQKLTAAQKGTAMHKFMQLADFSAAGDVGGEIRRLKDMGAIDSVQAECLDTAKLERFFSSELFRRMRGAERLWREFEFMVELPAETVDRSVGEQLKGESVVIQGVVDCAFLENGELVVVDYKTDRANDISELCEKYSTQLDIYRRALELVFELPVKQTLLYSFYLSSSAEI